MLPSLFLSHGSPMVALTPDPAHDFLAGLGTTLGRPRAILVASAHWETPHPMVNAVERNRTIHDFGGFPRALYELRYDAPGDPALAEQVSQLLQSLAESHASQQKTEAAWAAETLVWQQERAQFTEQAHRAAIDLGTVNQQLKDTAARHDNLMASHNILQSDYQRVLQEKARLEGRLAQQGEALTPPMDTQPAGDKA